MTISRRLDMKPLYGHVMRLLSSTPCNSHIDDFPSSRSRWPTLVRWAYAHRPGDVGGYLGQARGMSGRLQLGGEDLADR
jgi:hypothetical protein